MKKNESIDMAKETLDSVSVIAGVFTKLSALIAGLSALVILSGWKNATTYYRELGSPWVSGMLSPSALFQYSAQQFLFIGIIVFFAIYGLAKNSFTEKKLLIASGICLVIGIIILAIDSIFSSWLNFSPVDIYGWTTIATSFITLSAGLGLGVLVANLVSTKLKWNDFHLLLLYIVLTIGIWQSAEINAIAKAEYDGNSKSPGLPLVSLTVPTIGRDWRLVTNIDSSFLVVSFSEKKGDRIFRVLSANEISSIKSTRSK